MVQGQEKESAIAKLIPLRVELARLLDWVVLLLPETIWAEEDNKSNLFEQRAWRRAVILRCASLGAVLGRALRSCESPTTGSGQGMSR